MSGIRETNEASMVTAHKAGRAYWRANHPNVSDDQLRHHAHTCGWHGADMEAWLAGYYGERRRDPDCVH